MFSNDNILLNIILCIMPNKIEESYIGYSIKYKQITGSILPEPERIFLEFNKITTREESDYFFSQYGVGNVRIGYDRPFERQKAYEQLLIMLNEYNPLQYEKVHKGTPYYFIAWIAFQYHDYSKSIFYMDASVSEDFKKYEIKNENLVSPSLKFFLLYKEIDPFVFHEDIIRVVKNTLNQYNLNSGNKISINEFGDDFCKPMLYSDARKRSLLSALYIFLLEFQDIEYQLKLRSKDGGSIQPFLNHLFDGARILESLLGNNECNGVLKDKIKKTPKINVSCTKIVLKGNMILEDAGKYLNELKASNYNFQDYNFACAYIIRNTTGHSLLWQDNFTYDSYLTLYHSLINSIFWTIQKLWIEK